MPANFVIFSESEIQIVVAGLMACFFIWFIYEDYEKTGSKAYQFMSPWDKRCFRMGLGYILVVALSEWMKDNVFLRVSFKFMETISAAYFVIGLVAFGKECHNLEQKSK